MSPSDRRQRQLDELRELCHRGETARAIDLAFEHFACFGQDDDVVVLLERALTLTGAAHLGRRIVELRAFRR